ncbi:hypothetical protein Tco_1072614 [Tanacetum coccineum]
MEEINNFQQELDESLFHAWERFKELLMKCPQHYLTDMQEPSKKWLNTPRNGTMEHLQGPKVLKLLTGLLQVLNLDGACYLCKNTTLYREGLYYKTEEGKTLKEVLLYINFGAPLSTARTTIESIRARLLPNETLETLRFILIGDKPG